MTKIKTRLCKRILSLALAVILMLSLIPTGTMIAFAAGVDAVLLTVIDSSSEAPIKDAAVKVNDEGKGSTDENGSLELKDLTEGTEYEITVSKFGYAEEAVKYTAVDPFEKEIRLNPIPKVEVFGTVTDSDNNPLKDVAVKASGYSEASATTNESGKFILSDLYSGQKYSISAELAEYKLATKGLVFEGSNDIVLTKKDSPDLSFEHTELEVAYGTVGYNAASSSFGAADTYESEDKSIATVDDKGEVTPVGIGETKITAILSETAETLKSTVSYTVTVVKGEQAELVWSNTPPETLTLIDSFVTEATGGTGAGDVKYTTNDKKVATVDSKGKLTPVGAGEVTVTAEKSGGELYNDKSLSYTVNITKAPQNDLAFSDAHPNAIFYGNTYQNAATGGSVTDNSVEYSSSDESIATVTSDGTITALKSGSVTITATLCGNDTYEDVSAAYTIEILRADQVNEFRFEKGSDTQTIKYGEDFKNSAVGGENSPVAYKSSDEKVATVDGNGKITALKSGEVTITAVNPEDDRYKSKEISYTLIINRAEQSVEFDTKEIPVITYGEEFINTASAETGIEYTSSDEGVATVDKNGRLTTLKAGTVTITATAQENEKYETAIAFYTITINKAAQTISFEKGTSDTVTFNDNGNEYQNVATSDQQGDGAAPVYSISGGGENIEDFDSTTGKFKIIKAGTIIISVAIDSTDQYNTALASYTLEVEKAEQKIAFAKSEYTIVSGHDFASEDMPAAVEQGELYGTGRITYSCKDDSNGVVKSLSEDGVIELSYRTGTVTVVAEKSADVNYNEATAEYKLKVAPWTPDEGETCYTFDGDKADRNNEWYVGNVTLNAADGYLLSFENDKDSTNWQSSFADVVTTDGDDNTVSFFVKNSNGDISEEITKVIKKDEVNPTAEIITEAPSIFDKLLTIVTFGTWKKDVEYTVSYGDATSGVSAVDYYVDTASTETMAKETLDTVTGWKKYNGAITAEKDTAYVVYVRVTDAAGNYIYATTGGVIFDATKVNINISSAEDNKTNEKGYFIGNAFFDVKVSDAAPSSGIKTIDYKITVNGVTTVSENGEAQNLYTYNSENEASLKTEWSLNNLLVPCEGLRETDEIKLIITAEDLSGNTSEETLALHEISEPAKVVVESIEEGFYNEDVARKITVSGRPNTFNKDNIIIDVEAADLAGNSVEDSYELSKWEKADEDWVATITFKGNANYKDFQVSYKDTYKNEAGSEEGELVGDSEKYSFTVDHDEPNGVISISDNYWDTLLSKITFGLYSNKTVQVDVKTWDYTSGIESVKYFKTDEKTVKSQQELENYDGWEEFNPFYVDRDETFVVYAKITDKAGNVRYLCSGGYIVDTKESSIVITPEEANENGYYNDDVDVSISVTDSEPYSGIKSVEYWVEADGEWTQGKDLFTFDTANPEYKDLVGTKDFTVTVDAVKNNSDNVVVYVKTVDNAGNEKTETCNIQIDSTVPKASLTYEDSKLEGAKEGYFTSRTATLVVADRATAFDGKAAIEGIKITAFDAKDNKLDIDKAAMLSEWKSDGDLHTITITYAEDANYSFSFEYTNKAGSELSSLNTGEAVAPYQFTVDNNTPTSTVSIDENVWNTLIETLTFGLWKNEAVRVSAASDDKISPVTIEYFKTDRTTQMTLDELESLSDEEWNEYTEEISIEKDEMLTVYLRVTDFAGNRSFISSGGYIVDTKESSIVITPEEANENGYYNDDVDVSISVTDSEPYSGIKSVEYWVEADGERTQGENLFTFDTANPEYKDLVGTKDFKITVEAAKNNSDNVAVYVKTVDNAGNEKTETCKMKIDITKPAISLSYDNNSANVADGRGYFNSPRIATVVITERTTSFSREAATAALQFSGKDFNGNEVRLDRAVMISDWSTAEGATPDEATHTATIEFDSNANYTLDKIVYTDNAGNVSETTDEGSSVTPYLFTVDQTVPTGTVSIDNSTWGTLIEKLTFGLWKNETVYVSAAAEDDISPVTIKYYKTDSTTKMTLEELKSLSDEKWNEYSEIPIEKDEMLTVYLCITDAAGNKSFISTNGYIVDKTQSEIKLTVESSNENGYYNSDVPVDIFVSDAAVYSGIKTVDYWVTNNGQETQRENLYTYDVSNPTFAQLEYEFARTITVDSEKNNSDFVVVYVQSEDNAGNITTEHIELKIDTIAPTVELSFDVNNCEIYNTDGVERGYFKTDRTAKVVITERTSAFNAEKATAGITFMGYDSGGNEINIDRAIISEWTTVEGPVPDADTHTAFVTFDVDANYTLDISYTDDAGNANVKVDTGASVTPYTFTVDKTDPRATVKVRNNEWSKLQDVLTFGLWSNETVYVSAAAEDDISPVTIKYYKTDRTTQMSQDELDALEAEKWLPYDSFEIAVDEQFVVYLKITDNAGNYMYINSDGYVVDKTKAELKLTPDKTDIQHNGVGVYNKDVNVLVEVNEPKPYSGIRYVDYWVNCNGVETQRERIFEFLDESPTQAELVSSFNRTITVYAQENNSCDVVVYVGVTDNAGNYTQKSVPLDIDVTAPAIAVSYDNNNAYKVSGERGYFPEERTAKVVITERTEHFDEKLATNGIEITGVDVHGKNIVIDTKALIGSWNTVKDPALPDNDTHSVSINYSEDANYTFKIEYTDYADNTNNGVSTGKSVTPYEFTVDKNAPTGTVTVEKLGTWEKLADTLTFGLWSRNKVSVSGTSNDITSPIESVTYYKTDDTTAKTVSELKRITAWSEFKGFSVDANERFTVYLKIVDFAGNTTFISTDGVVVDDAAPVTESIAPEITVTPEQPVDGIYNTDVSVAVKVFDPKNNGAYSGLKEIRYEIYNMGTKTQKGNLYSFNVSSPSQNNLLQSWEKQDAIVVNKDLNNSNDVEIRVFAVDNAGNSNDASVTIKIDITNPSINVSYDNNDGDTDFADNATDAFFKANRTATVVITERNFDPDKVDVKITNSENAIPTLSDWTTVKGSGNGDGTTHTATVTFNEDGDYTFDVSFADNAGNKNNPVVYSGLATQKFTIDKTLPLFSISYDNNDAQNGNYYKADRTATLTVEEHNFEASRANVVIEAKDNGSTVSAPSLSEWTNSGDTHTARITYSSDALYTFDFDYVDKAGNATADIEQQRFYVDKTRPKASITKIVDESANNSEGNIGFVITATDTNFDVFAPVLTAVIRNGDKIETKEIEAGLFTDIANGRVYTVENLDLDGIYRITCTIVDKAGNAYDEITLSKPDGTTYVEKRFGNDTLLTFSVNRNGSTFELDSNTADLLDKYYVQRVNDDVVLVEINADPLKSYGVKLNDKSLDKNKYKVEQSGGIGNWKKYTYRLDKSVFEEESEYNVVVSSKDKATNNAFSDVKDAEVKFVVDRTAPVVTVTGLEKNGRYQTEAQTVTLIPTDDGGALKSLRVSLVDENGNVMDERLNLSEDDLFNALEEGDGKVTFTVPEGLYQNVRIECDDQAYCGDEDNILYDELFTDVSVTPSGFLIFWANKPLRYGSIAGIVAIVAGITAFVIIKKRKKKGES